MRVKRGALPGSKKRWLDATAVLVQLLVEGRVPPPQKQPASGGGSNPSPQASPKHDDDDEDWKPFTRTIRVGGETFTEERMDPTRRTVEWEPPLPESQTRTAYTPRDWLDSYVIQTPPTKKPKWAKGAGCTDSGTVFRAPHRLYTDQRVFRMNRAKRSGSVLIDASGSMGLNREAIENIVKAVPAAVIACYATGHTSTAQLMGFIRILAKWGRVVVDPAQFYPPGQYNEIDGHALRWLGMQPQPRIWISDGMVTGIGDCPAPNLFQESEELCRRYRIVRRRYLEEARKLL